MAPARDVAGIVSSLTHSCALARRLAGALRSSTLTTPRMAGTPARGVGGIVSSSDRPPQRRIRFVIAGAIATGW
jgi:hypothetical protein